MKRIVFYGDSNTYGYDPRGFFEMRYPENLRWTYKVKEHFVDEYEIVEEGLNGRCLPTISRDEDFLKALTGELKKEDVLVIMLGTNDILLTSHPNPNEAVEKMKQLLEWLKQNALMQRIIVIGPVPISDTSEELQLYHDMSLCMNAGFGRGCEMYDVEYVDATEWKIPLAYDGVHFSEEGCIRFADKMIDVIEQER